MNMKQSTLLCGRLRDAVFSAFQRVVTRRTTDAAIKRAAPSTTEIASAKPNTPHRSSRNAVLSKASDQRGEGLSSLQENVSRGSLDDRLFD